MRNLSIFRAIGAAVGGRPGPGSDGCYSQITRTKRPPVTLRTFLLVTFAAATVWAQGPVTPSPFDFFQPDLTLSPAERSRLDRGEPIVKSLPPSAREVAIFAAVRADISGDRLVAWVQRIDALKRGRFVMAVGRFSQPPRLDDLAGVTLEPGELDGLRQCRAGSCSLKLSASDIATLAPLAREHRPGWQAAVQHGFRQALLARAVTYLEHGLPGLPPYADQEEPESVESEFGSILQNSTFLRTQLPALAESLLHFPVHPMPAASNQTSAPLAASTEGRPGESFLYWSKEGLGGKPIISITHVSIVRPRDTRAPEAIVASRQIFASHYITGSLAVTAVIRGPSGRYLTYLNRSRVDILDGVFGGLVRRIVERRLREEAGDVVDGLRRRLESGDPPSSP